MHFDLEFEARTNGQFRHGLQQRIDRMARLEQLARSEGSNTVELREALWELIHYCNLNLVFLTPSFWPRYPKDKPLNFADFPFAFQMFEIQAGGYTVFRGSRQISKSTSFSCRQQLMARLIPGFKSLYIVPRNQQLKTYQYKMREIENAMAGVAKANEPQLRNNLGYKQFANGSTIELTYVLSSASSIRG